MPLHQLRLGDELPAILVARAGDETVLRPNRRYRMPRALPTRDC
jgi:hypothetical protein